MVLCKACPAYMKLKDTGVEQPPHTTQTTTQSTTQTTTRPFKCRERKYASFTFRIHSFYKKTAVFLTVVSLISGLRV